MIDLETATLDEFSGQSNVLDCRKTKHKVNPGVKYTGQSQQTQLTQSRSKGIKAGKTHVYQ